MAITSANKIPGAAVQMASGKFLDTGTVKKSILALGFKPRYFKLWDVSGTELVYEVTDTMAAGFGFKTAAADQTFETSGQPELIENYDSGAVNTWTVYESTEGAATDNSRLNRAGEKFTGVSIPAAVIATSVQAHWIAWA